MNNYFFIAKFIQGSIYPTSVHLSNDYKIWLPVVSFS